MPIREIIIPDAPPQCTGSSPARHTPECDKWRRRQLNAPIPGYGLKVTCYDMPRGDIVGASLPYSMETKAGGDRWSCTVHNPIVGQWQGTFDDISMLQNDPAFRRAVESTIAQELGVSKVSPLEYSEVAIRKRRLNFAVAGFAAVALGGALLYFVGRKKT